jgi:hypothetical protein
MFTVPLINPLRYVELDYSDNYNTKFFDLFKHRDTLKDFEQPTDYYQPFNLDDPLTQYIVSANNVAPDINYHRSCDGKIVHTETMVNAFSFTLPPEPGGIVQLEVYTNTTDLNDLGEGLYYARITDGTTTIESNLFCVSENHSNTILVKYRNTKVFQGVIFEKLLALDADFYFYLRVQGYIRHNLPERVATTYEDQLLNMTSLRSVPYNSWSYITDSSGIATYMIDLLNRVFGCSDLYMDNRRFTIPQEAKWEEKEEEFYPLRGWGIDLRERITQTSLDYNGGGGGDSGEPLPIVHDVDSDWWNTTAGLSTVPLAAVGQLNGYTVSQIYRPLFVFRSGTAYRIVDTTPSGDEVKYDDAVGLIFDTSLVFNTGETVTAMFEVVG